MTPRQQNWLLSPKPGHLVQFYKSESQLIEPLSKFIGAGLKKGESCLLVAKPSTIEKLNAALESNDIDWEAAQTASQYITLDASETLTKFMIDGLPDRQLFLDNVGSLIDKLSKTNRSCAEPRETLEWFGQNVRLFTVLRLSRTAFCPPQGCPKQNQQIPHH